jgi:hypothetical protein
MAIKNLPDGWEYNDVASHKDHYVYMTTEIQQTSHDMVRSSGPRRIVQIVRDKKEQQYKNFGYVVIVSGHNCGYQMENFATFRDAEKYALKYMRSN